MQYAMEQVLTCCRYVVEKIISHVEDGVSYKMSASFQLLTKARV